MKHLKAAIATVLLLSVLCVGGCNMAIPTMPIRPNEIKGLNQAYAEQLMSLDYSPDCQNIDVSEGIISTCGGCFKITKNGIPEGYTIERIFSFETELGCMIIGASDVSNNHKWYYMYYSSENSGDMTEIVDAATGLVSLTTIDPSTADATFVTNSGVDYMVLIGGGSGTNPVKLSVPSGSAVKWTAISADAPDGGVVTSHRYRTWISKYNDSYNYNTVAYSNAFDIEDWTTAGETGEIIIDNKDGGNVMAIKNIFDDVHIFKREGIWRVDGDIPADYATSKTFATEGTGNHHLIAQDDNVCIYMSDITGTVYLYDGNTCTPLLKDEIKNVLSVSGLGQYYATAMLFDNVLYIASSFDGKLLIYDLEKKKITVRTYLLPTSAAAGYPNGFTLRDYLNQIVFTDGTHIYALDDSELTFADTNIDAYWYTPETDFGMPNATKTLTNIYINGYGTTSAGVAGGQLKVTIYYNENGTIKTKEKTITLQTTTKVHNISLSVTGRSFKFKFENVDGSAFHIMPTWIYEVDKD